MSAHYLYDAEAVVEAVELPGTAYRLLRFNDAVGSGAWGFEHTCKTWPDPQEPDGTFVKVIAPRLPNHTVTRSPEGVTVRASIACRDCSVHGYVTDSAWEPV